MVLTMKSCISFDSYIKPQLNPTYNDENIRCISFDSYIKPQRADTVTGLAFGCISFDSYIKPQRRARQPFKFRVVYLLIPTSNHNYVSRRSGRTQLYIF